MKNHVLVPFTGAGGGKRGTENGGEPQSFGGTDLVLSESAQGLLRQRRASRQVTDGQRRPN